MPADGMPPAIKTFSNRPFFRGAAVATRTEAERVAASEKRSGRKTVVYPWHGTFVVYHAR